MRNASGHQGEKKSRSEEKKKRTGTHTTFP